MIVLEEIDDVSKLRVSGEVDDFILRFCGWGAEGVMSSVGCRPLVSEIEHKGGDIPSSRRRSRRRTVQGLVQVAHLPAEFPPEIRGFLILAISRHPILARHGPLRGTHTDARRTG